MDLSTKYLGLHLPHPLIVGASPLVDDLDVVRRLEDAGAAALVMHSLFEEQLEQEQVAAFRNTELHAHSHAEAITYLPEPTSLHLGPQAYLEQIHKLKRAVNIPVIASLNGIRPDSWLKFAHQMEVAGADALELNVYYLPTDPEETPEAVERRTLDTVRMVKEGIRIPVAVKLSPFFSNMGHFAKQVEVAGADGLVLFNRFLQPDFDMDNLEASPRLVLSNSSELLLRLRWLAILHPLLRADLAVTGGAHSGMDAIKAVAAGATAVQVVSAILLHGPKRLTYMRQEMAEWLEEHEYESLAQLKGSMSLAKCPDPQVFARANYMKLLASWKRTW